MEEIQKLEIENQEKSNKGKSKGENPEATSYEKIDFITKEKNFIKSSYKFEKQQKKLLHAFFTIQQVHSGISHLGPLIDL